MGSPQGRKGRVNGLTIFVAAVVLMVAATVGTGLYLAGSPSKERGRRFDEQRVSNLQSLVNAVNSRFERTGVLPQSIEELSAPGSAESYVVGSTNDPSTLEQYEYHATGESTYEVCAAFDLATPASPATPGMKRPYAATAPEMYPMDPTVKDWSHPAGRHCFPVDASLMSPRVACSLTNPCAAGQSCVTLPGKKGSVCVPSGKECLAAGCEGTCVVAESYPAQISCAPTAGKRPPNAEGNACDLMRNKKTGAIDCYGMGKSLAPGWEPYSTTDVGIPYSCYVDANGECALAQ